MYVCVSMCVWYVCGTCIVVWVKCSYVCGVYVVCMCMYGVCGWWWYVCNQNCSHCCLIFPGDRTSALVDFVTIIMGIFLGRLQKTGT